MTRPSWLLMALGNPSRGDDALGPLLIERLRANGVEQAGDVELFTEVGLQIEHVLDLADRRGVLFIDAARPGAVDSIALWPLEPAAERTPFTHVLSAAALLAIAQRLTGSAPAAWQLALEGEDFTLGADLSPAAHGRLDQGVRAAQDWLRVRRAAAT